MTTFRKQIASLTVMGVVPFVATAAAAVLVVSGIVTSENGRLLAGFVLVGGSLVVVLAVLAIVHVALQTAFHSDDKER